MNRPDTTADIRDVLDQLAQQDREATLPPNRLSPVNPKSLLPPSFGDTQRDAVTAIVGTLTDELHKRIKGVRDTLERIEQQALQSAADAKGRLNDHIVVCIRLNDEIEHMGGVVEQIHDLIKATD
jgi:hypothetical protein